MLIEKITLKNFRNHHHLVYEPSSHLNVIVGKNAVGKTNLAEAIYYLSLARSFRGVSSDKLIQFGQEHAEIIANVIEGKIKREIRIIIQNDQKRIYLNNKPISKLSELSKIVNILVFEPKDVRIFKDSPKERREFLDINISKKSHTYFDYISRYEKILKERNDILKQDKIDKTLLDTTTELLVKLSKPIIVYRQSYVKDINDILNKLSRALTHEDKKLEIVYKPFIRVTDRFEDIALNAYNKALENDLKKKATTIGIHREDFSIALNNKDIAVYGSQGENRMAALSLKLSPFFLIAEEEKKPIVILDDVMSELDDKHRELLIQLLKLFKQVFITATNLKINNSNQFLIKS